MSNVHIELEFVSFFSFKMLEYLKNRRISINFNSNSIYFKGGYVLVEELIGI
jgi:hypothetical protein